ncbi:hypothetical protein AB0A71_42595 [Kitasatospora aureofaciens]|uniref:hypothetical protein n=1 Tax=Kitasatospora aureofaciens TaxID=1894 RepID=UPI0033E57FB6
MSTSRALPVLRTPDLRAAHDAARRLLALATGVEHCDADGRTTARTVAEARRLYETFPDARATAHHAPPGFTEVRALFDAGDPRFDALLPLEFQVERPAGTFEERFLDVLGSGAGSLSWSHFFWPAVPELGMAARAKDSHLQIALNSDGVHFLRPAGHHTLFVHFRDGDVERARRLARQAGLADDGQVEEGW